MRGGLSASILHRRVRRWPCQAFACGNHRASKLVQLLDEIDFLVNWEAGKTAASGLLGREDVFQPRGCHCGDR